MLPEQLENVAVHLKANIYFDGGVISHSIIDGSGERKTIGLMRAGQYYFKTDAPERMDLIAGACRVKLAGEKEWKTYSAGQSFQVPGKSSFDIAVENGLVEYLCSFLKS